MIHWIKQYYLIVYIFIVIDTILSDCIYIFIVKGTISYDYIYIYIYFFLPKKKFVNILFTFSRWPQRSIVQKNQLWSWHYIQIIVSWWAQCTITISKIWPNYTVVNTYKKLPHEEHTIPLLLNKKSKIKPVLTAIQQNQSDHSRLFSSFMITQVR